MSCIPDAKTRTAIIGDLFVVGRANTRTHFQETNPGQRGESSEGVFEHVIQGVRNMASSPKIDCRNDYWWIRRIRVTDITRLLGHAGWLAKS